MPSFDYEITGTFYIIANTQEEANDKAESFVRGNLKYTIQNIKYKPCKSPLVKSKTDTSSQSSVLPKEKDNR